MLTKKTNGVANGPRLSRALTGVVGSAMDRRTFLKRSGVTAGGAALAASGAFGMVKKAEAQIAGGGEVQVVKSVCTHCSVGCTVLQKSKTVSGSDKNPVGTAHSIWEHTVPKGPPCARWRMASAA